MVKDLACGMKVDEKNATKTEYKGEIYYFCSTNCMKKFEKDPSRYVKKED